MNNVKSMFSQVFPWFMSWSHVFCLFGAGMESRYQQSAGDFCEWLLDLMIIFSDYLLTLHLLKTLNSHREKYMQMSEYHKFVNKTSEMTWTDEKMIFTWPLNLHDMKTSFELCSFRFVWNAIVLISEKKHCFFFGRQQAAWYNDGEGGGAWVLVGIWKGAIWSWEYLKHPSEYGAEELPPGFDQRISYLVSKILNLHPYLGKWSKLNIVFEIMDWTQLAVESMWFCWFLQFVAGGEIVGWLWTIYDWH